MKLEGDVLRLSATDLANHLACAHLTPSGAVKRLAGITKAAPISET